MGKESKIYETVLTENFKLDIFPLIADIKYITEPGSCCSEKQYVSYKLSIIVDV